MQGKGGRNPHHAKGAYAVPVNRGDASREQTAVTTLFKDDRKPINEYDGSLCVPCKGAKLLCGKSRCPLLVKFYARQKALPMIDKFEIEGSSPPSVFVGRWGYPKVLVGPMIPPIKGDTSIMDLPELWLGKTIDEIVDFRTMLVRGMHPVHIMNVEDGGRIVDLTREIAMAKDPSDVAAEFTKKPRGRLVLDDDVQPLGPSAPLKALDTASIKIDQRIEKAYDDTDLLSREAVMGLYKNGIFLTRIQRAFSVGSFGLGENRRFVPTRWSITAVDTIIGLELMKKVKRYPFINEYRVYESMELDNRFEVLMLPMAWQYELIEAWYPNTVWNPMGKGIEIMSDAEGYNGRKDYASIGGCYYAARLAVCEQLEKERRQAAVTIWREAHPGYILPVGVWNVRENVRNAMRKEPHRFNTMQEAFDFIATRLDIGIPRWIRQSAVMKDALFQKRIDDYYEKEDKNGPANGTGPVHHIGGQ